MNFPFYIAKRYLFSKKSTNVINIISGISIIGVATGTMALIVILSVFNGFDSLIKSLFNSFDSDLKITSVVGKTFVPDERMKSALAIPGIDKYAESIEDNALLKHREKQYIATIKGVSDDYVQMTGIDSMMAEGEFLLKDERNSYAIIGQGVAYFLSLGLNYVSPTIQIYVPKRVKNVQLNPDDAFNRMNIVPSGIFSIQQDFDTKYVIVPIEFARKLFDYTNEISSLEIKLKPNQNPEKVKSEIKNIIGNDFKIQTRYEQHELLFKIMKSEKWAIFLILAFILIIASFNIIGSLTMLIIDKQKDIFIYQSMGASFKTIRNIFLFEGWLISITGAILGLFFGIFVCWLQSTFGFLKLQGTGSFIIENYPVKMEFPDFIYVLATVLIIGFIAAWYPVKYITRKYSVSV